METLLYTILCMSVGAVIAIIVTKRAIRIAIEKADLCRTDRSMIRQVLGIQDER